MDGPSTISTAHDCDIEFEHHTAAQRPEIRQARKKNLSHRAESHQQLESDEINPGRNKRDGSVVVLHHKSVTAAPSEVRAMSEAATGIETANESWAPLVPTPSFASLLFQPSLRASPPPISTKAVEKTELVAQIAKATETVPSVSRALDSMLNASIQTQHL